MASFEAKVYRLTIEPHPNADRLEIARVGDYMSIVQKGMFTNNSLGVYIPEQAVLPDWLIEELGLTDKLAGKARNRVKAVKLRGIFSQGLVYPVNDGKVKFITSDLNHLAEEEIQTTSEGIRYADVGEGDDVTEYLGITKYEPPIPVHMSGEVYNAGTDVTLNYDIENFKKYPNVFREGEIVYFTEKLHGTFMLFVHLPHRMRDDKHHERQYIVSSKGLAAQGLALKHNEANKNNVYLRAAKQYDLYNKFQAVTDAHNDPIFVLGEIYGKGVQDLQYGVEDNQIGYRIFDVRVGNRWTHVSNLKDFCEANGLEVVPYLFRGYFSKELMEQYTVGKETVSGKELHMREGIVIRPVMERRNDELGRVILKSVSEQYLLRKGGTEFN